ncbi:hypothetical protein ZWY2020_055456 [Hordeum vulgare]|nr:hypothetical protein ZWY2020_055456 [Hordeum vulgare]
MQPAGKSLQRKSAESAAEPVVEVERVAEGVVVEAEPLPAPPATLRVQPPDGSTEPPVDAPRGASEALAPASRHHDDTGCLRCSHHGSHSRGRKRRGGRSWGELSVPSLSNLSSEV